MTGWPRTTPLGIIEMTVFGKAADLARHASFPRRLGIRWPETHRRAQPLRTEARNAKRIRKSPIPGIFAREPAPTGGVLWVAAFGIAKPRSRGRYSQTSEGRLAAKEAYSWILLPKAILRPRLATR
jgi:hypothetical protein